MIIIGLLLLSLMLDLIIPNLIKDYVSLFTITIVIISAFYLKDSRYYLIYFIIGIIYDLLFTNALFIDGIFFLLISLLANVMSTNKKNFIKKMITYYLLIIIYMVLLSLFTFYMPNLLNKLLNTFIISTLYFLICNMLLKRTYK